ncbi:MAG: hypothetical protein HRT89_12775, partial [Lentisphaeria bacterium]|nr:hypothetical protein [Lentisphaeria bacterium]NQZ68932.1 hypothetical protein [Lentisphaeria bacterium]
MKIFFLALCILPYFLFANLDDAKKQFAAQAYDKVDESMKDELAKENPTLEVLTLSKNAAMKSGRYLTAHRRVTQILKLTENKNIEMVFLGAHLAAETGNKNLAKSRYQFYLKKANAKNAQTKQSLQFLINNGAYPDAFRRFIKSYGNKGHFAMAKKQLDRLAQDANGEQVVQLAEFILQNFTLDHQNEFIQGRLWHYANNLNLGKALDTRYRKPLAIILASKPLSSSLA